MTALVRLRFWCAAAAASLIHAATAWRYGYFRDELYFIACAKHLAWGYVDQPPLVAIAAWLAAPFGYHLLALRALPILAAGLTVYVALRIVRELGGGPYAEGLTAITVTFAPAYLALGNLLTTSSFENLSWTLLAWLSIRLVRDGATPRTWIAIAATLAFGLYGKYSIGLLAVALLLGILSTRERRVLATPWLAACAALATLLVFPNLLWQAQHAWPFLQVVAGDAAHRHAFNNGLVLESRNFAANTLAYLGEQAIYTNPLAAPVWLAGVIAPFAWERLRALRFLSCAFAIALVAAIALEAKGYYTAGIYATFFALGSTVLEQAATWLRSLAAIAIGAVAVATLPLSLPVLTVDGFIAYSQLLGVTSRSQPHLIQPLYAEEFGWDALARDVAAVYDALPDKGRVAVYADTYADAGAIDFFGPRYGLPQAIGSQNTYWLWGPRDYDGARTIAVGASRIDVLKRYYRSCVLVRTSTEPLKWVVEGPSPIYLCTGPSLPLREIWPHLRWYGA
jgi:hypothetical protein